MILYHGFNVEIDVIDLCKCRPFKDFGRGFYTAPIREQALIMANELFEYSRKGDLVLPNSFVMIAY